MIITIASSVFIDWYFGFDTPKLDVPEKFEVLKLKWFKIFN